MKPYTKTQKRNEKIAQEYDAMISDGCPKIESYKKIGKKYALSVGGVRYAILCAKERRLVPYPYPIP